MKPIDQAHIDTVFSKSIEEIVEAVNLETSATGVESALQERLFWFSPKIGFGTEYLVHSAGIHLVELHRDQFKRFDTVDLNCWGVDSIKSITADELWMIQQKSYLQARVAQLESGDGVTTIDDIRPHFKRSLTDFVLDRVCGLR